MEDEKSMNIKNQSKFNRTIGIIILLVIALVGALLINSIFIKGASSGKTAEKNYIKAIYKNKNVEKVVKVSPFILLKESDREEYEFKMTERFIQFMDGREFDTANFRREGIEEINERDISKYEEYFLDGFDKKIKIKEGYRVIIFMKEIGEHKSEEKVEVAVIKIGNRWYAMDYTIFDWETLF